MMPPARLKIQSYKESFQILADYPGTKVPTAPQRYNSVIEVQDLNNVVKKSDESVEIVDPFANFKIGSLKVSIYRRITLMIFHTLNIIKQMGWFPEVLPEEQI